MLKRACFGAFLCASLFGVALASGGGEGGDSPTYTFERVVNFAIFVVLLWYLVADKLKAALLARSNSIASRLSESQSKVKEAREKKERALADLADAKNSARDIIDIAKREALISVRHIEESTKEQVAYLMKSNEEALDFREKSFRKQVILEVLDEAFASDRIKLKSGDYVAILEKRVA